MLGFLKASSVYFHGFIGHMYSNYSNIFVPSSSTKSIVFGTKFLHLEEKNSYNVECLYSRQREDKHFSFVAVIMLNEKCLAICLVVLHFIIKQL